MRLGGLTFFVLISRDLRIARIQLTLREGAGSRRRWEGRWSRAQVEAWPWDRALLPRACGEAQRKAEPKSAVHPGWH